MCRHSVEITASSQDQQSCFVHFVITIELCIAYCIVVYFDDLLYTSNMIEVYRVTPVYLHCISDCFCNKTLSVVTSVHTRYDF